MTIVADRLRMVMEDAGVEQGELAEAVGCTQGAISQILTGNTQRSRFLPEIAEYLRVSLRWLRGDDVPRSIGLSEGQPPSGDYDLVPIASIDQEFGLGGAFIADHVEHEIMQFPRAWVESFTRTPSSLLTFARGRGDSMQPTIHSHDMVLIDRSQRTIAENDAIWAYAVGEIGGIKRLRIRGDRVIILSDNPSVPPDEAMAEEVTIVGRVIMIIRSI